MKNKIFVIFLIISLLLPLITFTAFAADDIDNWGMLDAVGGFFRDLYRGTVDGFNNTIDSIKGGINSIGDFFANISKVITDAFDYFCDFIITIFLPSKDYFPRVQERLQSSINSKIGGILSLTEYLKDRFSRLSAPANIDGLVVIEFPQGHIFGGTRFDMLSSIRQYIPLFRGLLSGLMVLTTTVFAYRRVKSMINT